MKILHVIPSISPSQGGPSRAIVDMERALTARGLDVTTVTTNDDGGRTLAVPCGIPVAENGATRWYFPRNTLFYKVSIGLARWLGRNIGAFDVVHAHGLFSFAPVAAASIARRAGVPYVLRPLGSLARYGLERRRPLLKKLSFDLIDRQLVESASAVQFTSLLEQSEAQSLDLRCNGVVIPLGIDVGPPPQRRAQGGSRGKTNLLVLSRIDPVKNLEGLFRALALVVRGRDDVRLRIGGGGDPGYVRQLESLAAELKIVPYIEWLGHVTGERKTDALASADAFLLPSLSESFGVAAIEALAAGVPCIVSNRVAVQNDIAQARAGIVVGVEPESIAAGIETFLANEQNHTEMSNAARGLAVGRFSLESMGERLEALYREVCHSPSFVKAATA
ncbi:MAG: glycosyltransferase [Rhizomicrobium sp.]